MRERERVGEGGRERTVSCSGVMFVWLCEVF